MQGLFIKMREFLSTASSTEQMILRHLLEKPNDAVNMSIHQLAGATYTSPSTIVRLCRKLGFDGYKDFRLNMSYEIALRRKGSEEEKKKVTQFDSLINIVQEITRKNIVSLEDTQHLIDYEKLEKTVDLICNCRTLSFFGLGSSLLVAHDAYLKFSRGGKLCIVNADWHTQLLQAQNMTSEDLGVVLSYSGQTTEVIECIKAMKENNVPILTITRYGPSPIALLGDINLHVAANEPLFRSGAMSSRISQLNIIDIIYTAFVSRSYDRTMERLSATHFLKPQDI